jgi:hypothetical protein
VAKRNTPTFEDGFIHACLVYKAGQGKEGWEEE